MSEEWDVPVHERPSCWLFGHDRDETGRCQAPDCDNPAPEEG